MKTERKEREIAKDISARKREIETGRERKKGEMSRGKSFHFPHVSPRDNVWLEIRSF